MKKNLMMVLVAGIAMQTNAQWNNWHTTLNEIICSNI